MILREVMNSKAPYTLHDEYHATFAIDDKQYTVTFDPPETLDDPTEPVYVSFELTHAASGRQGELNISNTGDEYEVFGTVLAIIREYMGRYSPAAISFSAETKEPSRIKLYDRMVTRIASGWTVKTEILGTAAKVYELVRPS